MIGRDPNVLKMAMSDLYHVMSLLSYRDVVVVRNIPHHVGVLPGQIQPHVGGQDLIFLIQIYDLLQTESRDHRSFLH